jgi:hypothetical protein
MNLAFCLASRCGEDASDSSRSRLRGIGVAISASLLGDAARPGNRAAYCVLSPLCFDSSRATWDARGCEKFLLEAAFEWPRCR